MAARALGKWKSYDLLGVRRVRDEEWGKPDKDQDQDPGEEELGPLIARLLEGKNGDWMGHDARGRILHVKRGQDGAIEIRHAPGAGAGDEADPEIVGEHPGVGGDPARAAGRTGDALSRYLGHPRPERHSAGLAAYQARLNAYYKQ